MLSLQALGRFAHKLPSDPGWYFSTVLRRRFSCQQCPTSSFGVPRPAASPPSCRAFGTSSRSGAPAARQAAGRRRGRSLESILLLFRRYVADLCVSDEFCCPPLTPGEASSVYGALLVLGFEGTCVVCFVNQRKVCLETGHGRAALEKEEIWAARWVRRASGHTQRGQHLESNCWPPPPGSCSFTAFPSPWGHLP